MFESRRAKTAVILLGMAVVVAVVLSTSPFMLPITTVTHTQSSGPTQSTQPMQKGPPASIPITVWGKQDTIEHAKNVTGMTWVSLPTQVPTNLTLAPIRVKSDPVVTTITAIYLPHGVTISDNDTGDQVANAGGFSITYWKQIGTPGGNQTLQMEKVAKEFPNTTSLQTINGHLALIFHNEIQIDAGTCMGESYCSLMIDIGSRTLNSTELRPIAESIAILPHN